MKNATKIIAAILLVLAFSPRTVIAQQGPEIEVKSKVESVTVFLQAAQINRTADVNLKKGRNVVYFRGLGTGINPQSIQAAAPQAFLINSVIHEINYLDREVESPKVKMLQDSLDIIKKLVESNSLEIGVLENEKAMINRNQSIASKEQGLSIDELQKMVDFYRARLTEIYEKQLGYSRANTKLALRRTAISNQLNELNARRNRASNDIRVIVEAPDASVAPIALSYIINEAGWVPSYNIRAKDTQSPITLEYRADVYQNTGVDWEDVKLTLSSGNPNAGGTQPVLNPWNLYVQEPIVYTTRSASAGAPAYYKKEAEKSAPAPEMSDEELKEEGGYDSGDMETDALEVIDYNSASTTLANYTTVQEGATTAEFRIALPQTIRSNGKAEQVTVRTANLPAFYRHFAVPKLDNDAFLTTGLTGWDTLNLLPGTAQVFFEGTYVTEVNIDPAYTSDTLNLSLGRDKKVIIERNQLKDFSKVRTIGLNRERTFAWEIKVRNTKDAPINLTLEDQIPVSQDKEIVVTLVDASGAKLDEATGKLTWELNIAKAETKVVKLMYTVKYPKNKFVPGI
jgi:uncharacterized protein (TIGR02231 family)